MAWSWDGAGWARWAGAAAAATAAWAAFRCYPRRGAEAGGEPAWIPYTQRRYRDAGRYILTAQREEEVGSSIQKVRTRLIDARGWPLSLDHHGFVLRQHRTKVHSWSDDSLVEHNRAAYAAELQVLMRRETGASRVMVYSIDLRRSGGDGAAAPPRHLCVKRGGGPLGINVSGNKVTAVAPESAGAAAGLQPGMRLVAIEGHPVADRPQAVRAALAAAPDSFSVTVEDGLLGPGGRGWREPAGQVHGDVAPAFELAQTQPQDPPLCVLHCDRPPGKHFKIFNVWRSLDEAAPVQRDPLAFCEMASVADAADIILADTGYPGTYFTRLCHSAAHRWLYVARARHDEVLIHKQYDTTQEDLRRRQVCHCSAELVSVPSGARPRQSVEARVMCIFDDMPDPDPDGRLRRFMAALPLPPQSS